ncbi:hypothetical protein SUGI_0364780 [Cryptomeria japonica]|uniref:disease resistance RPP13-like protein 4 n=1 Tax=Cryptomeria japonica TaxID=3369 RepID=UPI002408AB0F|nr:disease resistance RPP13-like protein 4 [Cryptomeria japonica]GLJ20106.1 hypothetical protein SUGI_0364780 [Cryptomeria japonica]
MASALVDVVVEKLVGKLLEEINKEVSLVCNFRNDFKWLSKKLTNVRGYLTDADAQSAKNASVRSWLLDVADIAWDAEDILEECAVQSQGTSNESPQSSCVCAFSYSQLVFRCKMARRIKEVKDRMKSVMEDAAELKLVESLTHSEQPSTSTSGNVNWRGSPIIESDSKPVAIEPKVEEVLRLIDDSATPVIAVVGMGGVGKTFLMQNLFNKINKDKFEMKIWLSISQTYSLRKLQADVATRIKLQAEENSKEKLRALENLKEESQADMASQLKAQADEDSKIMSKAEVVICGQGSEVQAAQLIHECLTSRSSLIVLDDVWRATREDNLISALGLPTGNACQCKVVVTTRSKHVCSNMHARVYEVYPLSEEESWELFCAFAFPDCHQNQPPHQLEGIARQVERECARLPLAVKIVAASLACERSSMEWESKLGQLKAVSYTEDPIMQILKLSYDSLPPHLKPCFAYLSFFPEDAKIEYPYLINLWVAEGYVPQGEDQLDIGWRYICHLQSLCLIERVDDIYDQEKRMFKVHDLLLDLAISMSKESQCVFSAEKAFQKGPIVQANSRFRRILMAKKSIGDGDVNAMARNRAYSASRLRTLSFSENGGIQNIPEILLSSAKVLRVLDLSGTGISSLPDCVGNLKLLRVLNLSRTKISEVPECVKNNKSLRFLDISRCPNLGRLPEWIGELNCLEYLNIHQSFWIKYNGWMPKEIRKLVSLQVLVTDGGKELSVEENGFLRLEHFVNLVNLREVRIYVRHEAELKSIEDGILVTLVKMRNLTINNSVEGHANEGNLPPLSDKMLAMKDLEYLFLSTFAMPNWICGFSNLMELKLYRCHCAEYPALEMMPNLIKLYIWTNALCKALPKGFGKPGGFSQLRYLEIDHFSVLEELPELEDGAMPCLEILNVTYCSRLKKVPRGLELLRRLKKCDFKETGVGDMFEEGGELWNKIKSNNPNVRIKLGY